MRVGAGPSDSTDDDADSARGGLSGDPSRGSSIPTAGEIEAPRQGSGDQAARTRTPSAVDGGTHDSSDFRGLVDGGAGVPPWREAWPRGAGLSWKASALAAGGLALTFAAPVHRLDLLLIGLAGLVGGLLWCPNIGPVLIGGALPFFFFSRQLVGPVSVTPPGLALVLTWATLLVRHRRLDVRWPITSYGLPVALFVTAALLTLLATEYLLLSVRELRALIFEPVLFFWLLSTLRGSAPLALAGFLIGATVTALAAIVQGPLGFGGTPAEGVLRVQAWYPSANHLALMLGRAWPFLVAGAYAGWRWFWLPTAIVGLALVLTFSTGGWLGALAGTLVVVAALGRRRVALQVGGVAVVVLAVVSALAIAGVLPERLNPLRQTGGFRLDLWQSSLEMIRDHPWLGVGLDNFAYLYQQVYLLEGAAAEPNLSHPHNWVLHVWLELGLLGLIAFVWLLTRFWRQARRSLASPGRRWLVAGALGSMADLLVHGLIDNSYFLVDLAFVFWLALALVDEKSIARMPTT